jgi:hypothetical protein
VAKTSKDVTKQIQLDVIQDFKSVTKRLLEIVADQREPDFAEVEELAAKVGFKYNDHGQVVGG